MDMTLCLAEEFHLRPQQVQNTIDLIDQGNTIPFIARYRKEMTGSLDDQLYANSRNDWNTCGGWKNARKKFSVQSKARVNWTRRWHNPSPTQPP